MQLRNRQIRQGIGFLAHFMFLALLTVLALGPHGQAHAQTEPTPDNAMAMRWWNTLNAEQMVAALFGDSATADEQTAAKKMYAGLDANTKRLVNEAAEDIYGDGGHDSVGAWWETLNCELMRVAAGDGNTHDPGSPYCAHYPGSGAAKLLGATQKAHVDTVGQALLGRSDPGLFVPDNDMAMRWWNTLNADQMVAALFGDSATADQQTAAKKMYADLDPSTRELVHDATSAIYGDGGHDSVGAWWETLNCELMRVAAGDGNTHDPSSPYCAHYPGSGAATLLGAMQKDHVDTVGQALLDRSDPGVFPPDNAMAMRWWNTLNAEQMVAALFGDNATADQQTAAKKMYAELDPETKKLVHDATYAIYGDGGHDSVGAWWETLNCELMRVAAGDGNTHDPNSPYCAHYPGSGHARILGDEQKDHVDTVGQALLDRSDPGLFVPDNDMAMRWWNTLNAEQMVAALFGDNATTDQQTAAKKMYADLDPPTRELVNDAAAEIYGDGGHDSVGAWWETLNCELMRVAAGDGNTHDPSSPYCAHYPGSGAAKLLGAMQKTHVDTVGMALLDRSDPGVFPPVGERIRRVARVLVPAVARVMLSSTMDAVSRRVDGRLSGSDVDAAGLNLAGAGNLPDALAFHGKAVQEGAGLARLLARSSLVLPLNGAGNPGGLTLWGSGDYRNVSGAGDGIDWEGNVVSGHLGSDVMLRRNLLAGLSLSYSKGAIDYTDRIGADPRQGEYNADLTSLNPYVGWMLDSGIKVWATAGHGWGKVKLTHEDSADEHASDLTQWSAVLGAAGTLYSSGDRAKGSETAVNLKGEGALARAEVHESDNMEEITSTVTRLRLALEGTHTRQLGAGAVLTPSLELGVLADGGDGQTGTGVEIGGGVKFMEASLGLTVEGRGRALLGHGGDAEEWSVGGALRLDPGVRGQGWSLGIEPSWGLSQRGMEDLWQQGLSTTEDRSADTAMRVAGELGYNVAAFGGRGRMTPYAGFLVSEHGTREYRAGARARVASSLTLALQGTQRRQPHDPVEHGFTLRASVHW